MTSLFTDVQAPAETEASLSHRHVNMLRKLICIAALGSSGAFVLNAAGPSSAASIRVKMDGAINESIDKENPKVCSGSQNAPCQPA